MKFFIWATCLGALSAVSLPMGSLVGLRTNLRPQIISILAAFGAGALNHTILIFAEGLAAGAMVTMIASTMIPEAVHMGNASVVGLSTLAGFLSSIAFKLLE